MNSRDWVSLAYPTPENKLRLLQRVLDSQFAPLIMPPRLYL
jgi:hypothetical protein